MATYSMKSVKKTRGREGEGFTANIYRDGKLAGHTENWGDGGMTWVHFDKDGPGSDVEFGQWALDTIPASHWTHEYLKPEDPAQNVEMAAEYLFDMYQTLRDAKKNLLIRDGYTNLMLKGYPQIDQQSVDLLKAKYPNAEVFDSVKAEWVTVASL